MPIMLKQGVDFTCTGNLCKPISEAGSAGIKQLQEAINQYYLDIGEEAPLELTGEVDVYTSMKLYRPLKLVGLNDRLGRVQLLEDLEGTLEKIQGFQRQKRKVKVTSRERTAEEQAAWKAMLSAKAKEEGRIVVHDPIPLGPGGTALAPEATVEPDLSMLMEIPSAPKKFPWWIVGVAGVIGIGGAGYIVIKRRKR